MPDQERQEIRRLRFRVAMLMYGVALVLLLLAFVVDSDGGAGQYLFDGALITGGSATGIWLSSIWTRRT